MYSVRLAIARAKMVMGTIGGHDHHCRTLVPEQLWQAIQPLLPPTTLPLRRPTPRRRPRLPGRHRLPVAHRYPLAAVAHLLLGCSPVTCWRRLRDWQRAGVWQQLHHRLLTSSAGRASSTGRGPAWTR